MYNNREEIKAESRAVGNIFAILLASFAIVIITVDFIRQLNRQDPSLFVLVILVLLVVVQALVTANNVVHAIKALYLMLHPQPVTKPAEQDEEETATVSPPGGTPTAP